MVGIQVQFLLITVVCQLIVHTIKQGGTDHGLAVLKGLAHPDDEHLILIGDTITVALVQMLIDILGNSFLTQGNKIFLVHGLSSLTESRPQYRPRSYHAAFPQSRQPHSG